MNEPPLWCDRCRARLSPGSGELYRITIEAVADPFPPVLDHEDLARDPKTEIERIVAEVRELSEQDLMDQVHRRVTLFLCPTCYRQWIEHPTGS